jgi:excinuclease ABC subunit C
LNDTFRLRDCPRAQQMVFAEQAELFPVERAAGCLRYEIGTCLGPCLGACTRVEYTQQVRAARSFLAGSDLHVLAALESTMAEASAKLAYERAAALRDKLEGLRWLHERLNRLRQACARPSFIYPVTGHAGRELWYLIHQGKVVVSLAAPRSYEEKRAVGAVIFKMLEQKSGPATMVSVSDLDHVFLVANWFRRHPREQDRILPPEDALAHYQRLAAAS